MQVVTRQGGSPAETRQRPLDGGRSHAFASALGWIVTTWNADRLEGLTFGHRTPQQAVAAAQSRGVDVASIDFTVDDVGQRLQRYAEGRRDDFRDIAIDLTGLTDFQQRVVLACRQIEYGETLTYGELAERVDSPRAARAVGSVMARNRIALIVPCHRVVGGSGGLGGYSAPDGLRMKRRLLQLEGVV